MSEKLPSPAPAKNRLNLSLDLRIVVIALLAVIVAMLLIWKPWTSAGASDRTIEVTGEASIKAEPDEFVFSPTYQYDNPDRDKALTEATRKHDEIIKELKELGVADNKIKSDTSGFDNAPYYPENDRKNVVYSSTITVTAASREQAQKIQDYLVTTSPVGSISPQASFSDAKRKELENKARDEATKNARAKADQTSRNLGAKVGKVKSVTDGAGFDGGFPVMGRALMAEDSVKTSLAVQPGENELNYTVTVVYYIK